MLLASRSNITRMLTNTPHQNAINPAPSTEQFPAMNQRLSSNLRCLISPEASLLRSVGISIILMATAFFSACEKKPVEIGRAHV